MKAVSYKKSLLICMESTADFRQQTGNRFPNDVRNMNCAKALGLAIETVSKLPADHPLFIKLEKANEIGMERWSERETQFMSRWGYFDGATPADSGFRFIADLTKLATEFLDKKGGGES
jgi:hypothetical protein